MADAEVGVGSLISLISKSDVRYEGILFTINVGEGTIALLTKLRHRSRWLLRIAVVGSG